MEQLWHSFNTHISMCVLLKNRFGNVTRAFTYPAETQVTGNCRSQKNWRYKISVMQHAHDHIMSGRKRWKKYKRYTSFIRTCPVNVSEWPSYMFVYVTSDQFAACHRERLHSAGVFCSSVFKFTPPPPGYLIHIYLQNISSLILWVFLKPYTNCERALRDSPTCSEKHISLQM